MILDRSRSSRETPPAPLQQGARHARHLVGPPWWCCRSSPCVCSSRARVVRYPETGWGSFEFGAHLTESPNSERGVPVVMAAGPGYLGPSRARPDFGGGRRIGQGGHTVGTYHVGLAASFFIFLICLVAHWLSCFVLVLLERRPCVSRSLMGSTSTMLSMCEPKAVSRSLQEKDEYNRVGISCVSKI